MTTTRCPECYQTTRLEREPDRSGRRVCFGCFVPLRSALPAGATDDFTVAPPNAKNVTPRRTRLLAGSVL